MPKLTMPLSAATLLTLAANVYAQQGRPPEPPTEAYAACQGRNAGDLVSFTVKDHTIEGSCEKIGDRLALRPSRQSGNARQDGHRGGIASQQ